jgi:hypothetical protein
MVDSWSRSADGFLRANFAIIVVGGIVTFPRIARNGVAGIVGNTMIETSIQHVTSSMKDGVF